MASRSGNGGIRLRPLTIADLLDETFNLYRRNFLAFLLVIGIVLVPTDILVQPIRLATDSPGAPLVSVLVVYVILAIHWVTDTLTDGAVTLLAANVILGRPLNVAEAYRQSLRRFRTLLWATFRASLKVFLYAISIVGIIHAVHRYLGWALIDQAVMLEGQGAPDAMRRSWELMDGQRRRMLAYSLLLTLLNFVMVGGPEYLIRYGIRLLHDGSSAGFWAAPTMDTTGVIVSAVTGT